MKENLQLFTAAFLILIGCGLLIAAFCIVPVGEINNSVLIAFGEVCTFAGALFGVDYHYRIKR